MRIQELTIMRRTRLVLVLAAALTTALAAPSPAAAQIAADRPTAVAPAGVQLIDVKAAITDPETGERRLHDIQPAEHVPLRVGERVHVQIVGTAMIDGTGREVLLPVRFEEGPGDWRIDTAPHGEHGVTVVARTAEDRGREGHHSQVLYTIQGDYDVRRQLAEGRITFVIGEQVVADPEPVIAPQARERWQRAERIADDLVAIRYAGESRADAGLVERIYLSGATEVRQIASTFAQEAVRARQLENRAPWDVVGHLYRELLGREGSAEDLWQADAGFRGNMRLLMESGYPALVSALVGSPEFARNHELDAMTGRVAQGRSDEVLTRLRQETIDAGRSAGSTRP